MCTKSIISLRRKFFLLLACLLTNMVLFAQVVNKSPYIPSSPTASELGKYGSLPVSYYSGTPSIEIPIYKVQAGNFELPISLTYNSSGVRVEDIASWVGLGWSLSAGGVVSVNVRDKSDFSKYRVVFSPEDLRQGLNCTPDEFRNDYNIADDSEPDVFNYNFCGYTGQFVLDKDLTPRLIKDDGSLRFSCTPKYDIYHDQVVAITITAKDNNGRTFIFNDVELSDGITETAQFNKGEISGSGKTSDVSKIITAVYLSKVILEDNTTFNFYYRNETQKYSTRYSGVIRSMVNTTSWDYEGANGETLVTRRCINNYTKVLDRITCSKNQKTILFKSYYTREDLPGGMLNEIIVYKDSLLKNRLSCFRFGYDYFTSSLAKSDPYSNVSLDKRLKLASIKEYGQTDDVAKNPYTFHYFGDDDPTLKLPYRTSFSGNDSWGYCNKAVLNEGIASDYLKSFSSTPIPQSSFLCANKLVNGGFCSYPITGKLPVPSNAPVHYSSVGACSDDRGYTNSSPSNFYRGEDKNPAMPFAAIATLDGIEYPTGGKTTFEYELNRYYYWYSKDYYLSNHAIEYTFGGLRIKKIKDITDRDTLTRNFTYEKGTALVTPKNTTAVFGIPIIINQSNTTTCMLFDWWEISADIIDPYSSTNGNLICYPKVTERTTSGSTAYEYASPLNFNLSEGKGTFIGYYQPWDVKTNNSTTNLNRWGSADIRKQIAPYYQGSFPYSNRFGLLNSKILLSENGDTVRKETYDYIFKEKSPVYGNQFFVYSEIYCTATAYSYERGYSYLNSKTNVDYTNNKPVIVNTAYYTYDNDYGMIKKEWSYNNGKIYQTDYRYANDTSLCSPSLQYSSIPIFAMRQKEMYSYPLEITKSINYRVVESTLTKYKSFGNVVAPQTIYKLNTAIPIGDFTSYKYSLSGIVNMDKRYVTTFIANDYDDKGNLLEYSTNDKLTRVFLWDNKYNQLIASATNPNYYGSNYFLYTSFENPTESNIVSSNDNLNGWAVAPGSTWYWYNTSKTGSYSIGTSSRGCIIRTMQTFPAGKYIVSWYGRQIENGIPSVVVPEKNVTGFYSPNATDGSWRHFKANIVLSTNESIGLSVDNAQIDELRIYPVDARMITYAYSTSGGINSICNERDAISSYYYDGLGRLTSAFNSSKELESAYSYSYYTKDYYNKEKNAPFTKNTCAAGDAGSSVSYTVPAGKYTSTLSQIDADNKAQADVNANGQAYANSNGICYYLNPASSSMSFTGYGGTQGIAVSSNTTWDTASSDSWITVTPSSANGNVTPNITCSANTGVSRIGTVTLQSTPSSGGITKVVNISQVGSSFLNVDPTFLEFDWVNGIQDVNVSSSPGWNVVSKVGSFITATKMDEQTLTIRCLKNAGTSYRYGTVTLSNGTDQVTIEVYQNTSLDYPQI